MGKVDGCNSKIKLPENDNRCQVSLSNVLEGEKCGSLVGRAGWGETAAAEGDVAVAWAEARTVAQVG